jgi:predicted DNA-binding protein (MmcQ/YjbR family)
MLSFETVHAQLAGKPGAVLERPFGPDTLVYKVSGKVFAIAPDTPGDVRLTVKCDPHLAEVLRGEYAAITPGYHTDKRHWVTIRQDRDLPDDEVARLIDHAYDLVRAKLPRAVQAALPPAA